MSINKENLHDYIRVWVDGNLGNIMAFRLLDFLILERDESQSKLDTLSTRFTALMQQNNTLAAENERLSEELAAMYSQEPAYELNFHYEEGEEDSDLGGELIFHQLNGKEYPRGTLFYAKPVPADKPAVAVPDEVIRTLARIAKWHGEFPEGPPFQGKPQSYGAAYGSNGERDYMRGLAAEALELLRAPSHSQQSARTPQDYAIEHAEYMAVNGEQLIEYLNEISDAEEGVLVPDDRFGDYVQGLRCGIHDFRKRRDRCPSHESDQYSHPSTGDSKPIDGLI